MADKPSRGLVLYGDGLMRSVSPSHKHLHDLASRGACGFLSLPHSPPAESEDDRVVREFAQLLDAYDSYILRSGNQTSASLENSSVSTISERFMGLRAAILTNDSSIRSFAGLLGFTVIQFDELAMNKQSPQVLGLLKLLGFEGGKTLETNEFDLVFVHIGSHGKQNDLKIDTSDIEIELITELVGGILQIAQCGEISSRLHFSLVMSYGALVEDENSLQNLCLREETHSDVSSLLPRQSYTITRKGGFNNIRHHCPMLLTQWQDGVTRKDMANGLSFQEFKQFGANLAIPADRFLHEVAFKLWKAPKYGA